MTRLHTQQSTRPVNINPHPPERLHQVALPGLRKSNMVCPRLASDETTQTVQPTSFAPAPSKMLSATSTPYLLSSAYPVPQPGAALPLTFHPSSTSSILIIGTNKLAANRAFTFLEAGSRVVVAGSGKLCDELAYRFNQGQIEHIQIPQGDENDPEFWTLLLESSVHDPLLVTVTDTVINTTSRRSSTSAQAIHRACRSFHLPINVTDHPGLSTFTFPAVHRFPSSRGPGHLQVAVTTNGLGCRLAGRIKRDIASGKPLPRNIGQAVENVGKLRERARKRSRSSTTTSTKVMEDEDEAVSLISSGPLNSPVPQLVTPSISRGNSADSDSIPQTETMSGTAIVAATTTTTTTTTTDEEEQLRRMRWVSQVSEYWSTEYLARMTTADIDRVLQMWGTINPQTQTQTQEAEKIVTSTTPSSIGPSSSASSYNGINAHGQSEPSQGIPTAPRHDLALAVPPGPPPKKQGRILLLGSGPGHPSLLTIAAHTALNTATLILSDKLVPSEILALIPTTTQLHIAKKFPGNAEGAQNEMMQLALEGAQRGEIVVRLKQGDPYVYGRGGEEVLFFREHGFECTVVPGVSSALAGPLMFGIPVTQRGVAESFVLCTGVGRKGKAVQLPGYVRSRSLVVLMGVARIRQVLDVLQRTTPFENTETQGWRDGPAFPSHLPIAIIERASSHDQRMVASTLAGIEDALERSGEQRPPGMMIIGWACLALEGAGEVTVLDDEEDEVKDKARVDKWLAGKPYILKDGLSDEWKSLLPAATTE